MIPRRLFRSFHRPLVIQHLQCLQDSDRRMRFGAMMPDDAISDYVQRCWDDDNMWFGVVHGGIIIAAVHVAYQYDKSKAELGLSVDPEWRGHKLGQGLFDRAVVAMKARNVRDVYMHCLAENAVIKHIARKNNMVMVTEYGETDADLLLTEGTPADVGANILLEQLAVYDSVVRNTSDVLLRLYEIN